MAQSAAQVYRKYKTDGVASSGLHNPKKAEIRELLEDLEQAVVPSVYASVADAQGSDIDVAATEIIIAGRTYKKVDGNPFHSRSFLHDNGNYYDGVYIPTTGRIGVHCAMGQSPIIDIAGTPGGNRSVQDGVLVMEAFPREDRPSGLIPCGPEDPAWPLRETDTSNVTNSRVYRAAVKKYRASGDLQIVLIQGAGGLPQAEMLPGGGGVAGATGLIWTPFQGAFQAMLDAPIPGRAYTLRQKNKLYCDYFHTAHGQADANYRSDVNSAGYNPISANAVEYLSRAGVFFDALRNPTGESVQVIDEHTTVLVYELMRGSTNGGAPGVGDPLDDRNNELSKLRYFEGVPADVRDNMKFVRSGSFNKITADGDEIGTHDFIHENGAAVEEIAHLAFKEMFGSPRPVSLAVPVNGWFITDVDDEVVEGAILRNQTLPANSATPFVLPYPSRAATYYVDVETSISGSSSPLNWKVPNTTQTTEGFEIVNGSGFNAIVDILVTKYTRSD